MFKIYIISFLFYWITIILGILLDELVIKNEKNKLIKLSFEELILKHIVLSVIPILNTILIFSYVIEYDATLKKDRKGW